MLLLRYYKELGEERLIRICELIEKNAKLEDRITELEALLQANQIDYK